MKDGGWKAMRCEGHTAVAKRASTGAQAMTQRFIDSRPHPWPWNGDLRVENTALVVIDMQFAVLVAVMNLLIEAI
jgi:hypothetical protein